MNRCQKLYSHAIKKLHEQHGVTSLVMAISAVMLLGFTAMGIDLGHAWMVKQELQNVADAAALENQLYREMRQMLQPHKVALGSRYGASSKRIFKLKQLVKRVIGRSDPDLYNLQDWIVFRE